MSKITPKNDELEKLEKELEEARAAEQRAKDGELRALADYHNLSRRTQDDRSKMVKFAGRDIIENLFQPLEHLYLATEQLKNPGLTMVYQQFQKVLQDEGVSEITALDQPFDAATMEVLDKAVTEDPKQVDKVIKVAQRGYLLHGEVIRFSKVVLGIAADEEEQKTNIK